MRIFFQFSLFILIFFLITSSANSQVIFKEIPDYKQDFSDRNFFELTSTRSIIPLNGNWKVKSANEETEESVEVKVPSIFEGEGELIFEKNFELSRSEIENNSFELVFLGINYLADISVNDYIIFRHAGGEFPFRVDLAKDILKYDSLNVITVKLTYSLDSKNTIPLKQRYLFPQNFGGIIHDVYIYKKPTIFLSEPTVKKQLNFNQNEAAFTIKQSVVNHSSIPLAGEDNSKEEKFYIKFLLNDPQGIKVFESQPIEITVPHNKEKEIEYSFKIKNPLLWSPENPQNYHFTVELLNDEEIIDILERDISIFQLTVDNKGISLNNNPYELIGVTYVPEFLDFSDLVNYNQFEEDIKIIKQAGFNAIRIPKTVPHPYVLSLCEKYGLLAFIELPVSMAPENLTHDQNFAIRCKYFLSSYLTEYGKYSSVAAIGLGSSFLGTIEPHNSLLNNLSIFVKENSDFLTYASFGNTDIKPIENLDLYGIEILNTLPSEIENELQSAELRVGKGKLFISEATYTVNIGSTDGYVNKYSYEAQAKYFSDLIDYFNSKKSTGYFINSMFDYRGDYASLLSGYNSQNRYNVGLAEENRSTNRLAFKVVSAKLNQAERVTIPIGSPKDDAPMVFILFGLILAVIMGVLVNSGRKFREDASRALLRPYNFYADVRDQRIMSVYHTAFLGFIIVSVIALNISSLLFYLRTNIIFEKLLLTFGSATLMSVVDYLCWFPFNSLIWLLVISVLFLIILMLIIKGASLFVKAKVYLSSIFFMVIWAMLPLVFLIPLGIVLYRVLYANVLNVYMYLIILIFTLWVFYRLMKGIYVLFDVSQGSVYFYSLLFILLLFGGTMFYFEFKHTTIQFMLVVLKQYNIF